MEDGHMNMSSPYQANEGIVLGSAAGPGTHPRIPTQA
jgi:hypothetical protein